MKRTFHLNNNYIRHRAAAVIRFCGNPALIVRAGT